jgi:amidase
MAELWQMSGLELGAAIASKEVSSTEVLDALLARIEAVNPKINAIVTLAAETARAEALAADEKLAAGDAHGPLFGVPVSIKELRATEYSISS